MSGFSEFSVATNFTFLGGASHPEELVALAAMLGLEALGVADRNTFAGVVRAHVAKREMPEAAATPLKIAIGCRLVFSDGAPDILAYPRDRSAYGRLCQLLTLGNRRARKGDCDLTLPDLLAHRNDLQLIVLPLSTFSRGEPEKPLAARAVAGVLRTLGPRMTWLAGRLIYGPHQRRRLAECAALARDCGTPLIATNDVRYHAPERCRVQDVLSCIREGRKLEEAGALLEANAERHLKTPSEMRRLFSAHPEAIAETGRFLEGLTFSLDDLRYDYPDETRAGFATPQAALEHHAREGAARRYPRGVPEKIRAGLDHELALIGELGYAPYFLTVHDIVDFARSRGILCQGRGSAANSTVCYCLGVTEVDPARNDLLFERFISAERREPPDIDVDFEHERREEVFQYIYERYGREHVALAASLITYRSRSALRDVGKAFGLPEDMLSALSGLIWGWSEGSVKDEEIRRIGFDPHEPRLRAALDMARQIIGFPRHLSQHTGGFVFTRSRLDTVTPIANAAMEGRTTVEWDKNDLDALGILKVDVLALGMLSCLRRAFSLLAENYGKALTLSSVPAEDPAVYRMISRADTLGVFQIESRAQMSMLPRMKPACFYDLVIEVAIVRPGPIQGDMVHPYLRRREGREPVHYPSPAAGKGEPDELQRVLGKTLGVPLFQEQAMRIAIVAAGFTPSEADRLRRAMATFRRVGTIHSFQTKMVEGMVARGYEREFAERCFRQIEGFGEYGFPESHAASFALLVYVSCWFKCHYPDVFAAALLNAQPMGFYAPAQIVRDARDHGVDVRPVDINHSTWDARLEPGPLASGRLRPEHRDMEADIFSTRAVRLGLRAIKGFGEEDARLIAERRGAGFDSVRDLWLRTGLSTPALERLAEADAFRSLGLDRREALWSVKALRRSGDKDDLPLLALAASAEREPDARLPPMPPGAHVVEDYRKLSLSLKAHPVSFLRMELARDGVLAAGRLPAQGTNRRIEVAGLVLVRQRPGTAKGVIFMTLEDETGVANVIVWPQVFEMFRPLVLGSRFCAVRGRLQNEKGVIHVIAESIRDLTPLLARLTEDGPPPVIDGLARADEVRRPGRDPREREAMPRGRNFH